MAIRLCLNESTADLGATLAGREADSLVRGALLDLLVSLGEDELNVAGVGHVGVDLEKGQRLLQVGRKRMFRVERTRP
jgi:hypothetical protein